MAARVARLSDHLAVVNKIWFSALPSLLVRNFRSTSVRKVSYVYQLEIRTGNVFGAGTDANVFVRIIGEKGSTEEVKLQTCKGDLERGMVNSYKFSADNVGKLHKLIVRHDNTGIGPAWFLDKVTVKDNRGKVYNFPCNDWLSKGKDNSTKILLHVQEESSDLKNDIKSSKTNKVHQTQNISTVDPHIPPDEGLIDVMKSLLDVSETPEDKNVQSVNEIPAKDQSNNLKTDESAQSAKHASTLSPAVRNLIDTYGVDLFKVSSSGPHGRVLKGDVLKYLVENSITEKRKFQETLISQHSVPQTVTKAVTKKQSPVQTPHVHFVDHMTSEMEQSRANKHATNKFCVPHIYLSSVCCLDTIDKYVEGLNDENNTDWTSVLIVRAFLDALAVISSAVNVKGAVNVSTSTSSFQVTERNSWDGEGLVETLHVDGEKNVVESSPFSLNILPNEEVSFVSRVLNLDEMLNVTVSGVRLAVDLHGNVKRTILISLTCDGTHVDSQLGAIFLNRLVKNIGNPMLASLS